MTFEGNTKDPWGSQAEIQGNLFNYVIDQEFRSGQYVDIVYTINIDNSINIDCMKHNIKPQIFIF